MKKIFSMLAAVMLAGAPMIAQAATFVTSDQYSQSAQAPVSGNLYVAAGVVSITSGVSGDVFALGGTISLSGRVDRDLTAAGGTVQVSGPIGDDVRVAGGTISLSDHVGGDLIVGGGTVNILPSAVIHGDVYVAGGQVLIDGVVQGDVHARTSKSLTLGSSAHISGTLSYASPVEATIAQGARVDGATTYTPKLGGMHVGKGAFAGTLAAVVAALTAAQMLAYLGFVVVVVWLWRRWATELSQDVVSRWWPMVGHGLIYTILVPVAAVLLLLSFVGAFFGGLAILTYVGLMIMAKGLAGVVFGAWVVKMIKHKPALQVTWTNAILGTIGFMALTFIPILGWIAQALVVFGVFGVLAGRVQKMLV